MDFFRLFFTCAYLYIIPKTIFIRKKLPKNGFLYFCHKMVSKSYNIPLMEFFTLAFACAYP